MKKEIFYATGNPAKFEEVKNFIETNEPAIILKQFEADIPEIQTMDQKAIALDKAQKAWKLLQKPLIVDDSGIYFTKYNKFPGTISKHISIGIGFEGLKNLIEPGDNATFLLHMIYIHAPKSFEIFEGRCEGKLIKPEKFSGHPHYPYDCLFIPNGIDQTYAQLRKTGLGDEYSYRIQALKKFLNWYKKNTK